MKKIFLLALFVGFSGLIKAQKIEVYGAYGLGSAQEIIDGLSDMVTTISSAGITGSSTDHRYGPVMVGVNYYLTPRLSAGVLYSNTSSRSTVSAGSSADSYYKNTYNVFMARTDYRYVNHMIQLYSGISVGTSFAKTKPEDKANTKTASSTDFAYQVNAFGIRAGKNIGAFAELGFGYNGIVNLGVSAKF